MQISSPLMKQPDASLRSRLNDDSIIFVSVFWFCLRILTGHVPQTNLANDVEKICSAGNLPPMMESQPSFVLKTWATGANGNPTTKIHGANRSSFHSIRW